MSNFAPELTEAYRLIKSGERQAAGKLLKTYLAQNQRDPQAWWLMAHAVAKPEQVEKCLVNVLKLQPDHPKARARLDKLRARSASLPQVTEPAAPASAASLLDDEPDESMILGGMAVATPTTSAPAESAVIKPLGQPANDVAAPAPEPFSPLADVAARESMTFEEYVATDPAHADPFAGPVVDDPFADVPDQSVGYDPFAPANAFDPAAAAGLGNTASAAQAPGTGNQPEWGPGLAFVSDADNAAFEGRAALPRPTGAAPLIDDDDFAPARQSMGVERMIGIGVVAVATVVLVGLVLYVLVQGSGGDGVSSMRTFDAGSFRIDYPKNWHRECRPDALGYTVCGIANHEFYNEIAWYTDGEVDLGDLVQKSFSWGISGDLPDEQVSIIVMDVPRSSPSYDNGSLAKTKWEWYQDGWGFYSGDAQVTYQRQETTIDNRPAYYYEYHARDTGGFYNNKEAVYDVYIEHDGIILWMTVSIYSDAHGKDYDDTIQKMIESLEIKPVEDWG